MKLSPVIIVDSREQRAWQFENLPSMVSSLSTGDYSIAGLEHLIAVERKSLDDLLSCIGTHRDRFKRELQRLRAYRFRCLIVETDYSTLEAGEWRSRLKPSHVLGSLSAWMAQFELPIWLAGTHEAGAEYCERYLFQCARLIAQENAAVGVAEQCVA